MTLKNFATITYHAVIVVLDILALFCQLYNRKYN